MGQSLSIFKLATRQLFNGYLKKLTFFCFVLFFVGFFAKKKKKPSDQFFPSNPKPI